MEIERARLTKTLATIKEQNGEVKEAASILQELQVTPWSSELHQQQQLILTLLRLLETRSGMLTEMPGMR